MLRSLTAPQTSEGSPREENTPMWIPKRIHFVSRNKRNWLMNAFSCPLFATRIFNTQSCHLGAGSFPLWLRLALHPGYSYQWKRSFVHFRGQYWLGGTFELVCYVAFATKHPACGMPSMGAMKHLECETEADLVPIGGTGGDEGHGDDMDEELCPISRSSDGSSHRFMHWWELRLASLDFSYSDEQHIVRYKHARTNIMA